MNVAVLKRFVPSILWPHLGALRRFVRTRQPRPEMQKKQLLRDPSLSIEDQELLSRVSSRIYHNDGMYHGNGQHYFKVGLSAIHCIDEGLERAGLSEVHSLLDLPCGGGRVMRFLRVRFPAAQITACDLNPGMMQFCVRTFGAEPALSSLNLDEVSFGRKFDFIWCGSLVTHLNDGSIVALLRMFRRHLIPGGLLMFTTHGDYVAGRIPTHDFDYGLSKDQVNRISVDYPQTGYAFEDYPGEHAYGVSLTSPDWVRRRIREVGGFQEVYFKERGWDNHQDVFGFIAV